jgi:hypothetical protein
MCCSYTLLFTRSHEAMQRDHEESSNTFLANNPEEQSKYFKNIPKYHEDPGFWESILVQNGRQKNRA